MTGPQGNWFKQDYAAARSCFLEAAVAAGAEPQSVAHPLTSTAIPLATDAVRFGADGATKLIVLTSGVHGPELMCGSGCQVGLMRSGLLADLPANTAVLLVHGVNPWGAQHLRRNNEDNVDLCRNFPLFDQAMPVNTDYESLHQALNSVEGVTELYRLKDEMGPQRFLGALMGGQFQHAEGFGYGGNAPVWSHRVLLDLLAANTTGVQRAIIVDYHSGVGPYGYGTAVCLHRDAALARAQRIFGHWVLAPRQSDPDNPEGFREVEGHCTDGYVRALPDSEVTSIVLEFGTLPLAPGLKTLIDEHRFYALGDASGVRAAAARSAMLEHHLPDDPMWRESIWQRAQQVLRQALAY